MKNIEKLLYSTDFSRDTDLKERLAKKLFSARSSGKVVAFPFRKLSDDDLELVNAAQGQMNAPTDPDPDKLF